MTKPIAKYVIGILASLTLASLSIGGTVEGFAEPYRKIEISGATEPGLITEIRVKEGDVVKAGDILATLDHGVLEASLQIALRRSQMRGRLEAAGAERSLWSERTEKLRLLREQGHASPVELQRAEADLAVAEAQYKLAEEELELAALEVQRIQAQIEQRIFRSPVDGIVSEIEREVGESILMADPALLTVVQLNPLRVRFPVAVGDASRFLNGDQVQVRLPEVSQTHTATVELVAPVLDAKSGTVQITCVLDNAQGTLRSGMRCLLQIPSP